MQDMECCYAMSKLYHSDLCIQGGSARPRAAAVGGRRLPVRRRQRRREPEAEPGQGGLGGRESGAARDAVAVVHGAVQGAQAPPQAPRRHQLPPHEVGQDQKALQF